MPTTNRPFFANFFAAFRAHSLQKTSSPARNTTTTATPPSAAARLSTSSLDSSSTRSQPRHAHTPAPGPSAPRPIASKSSNTPTSPQPSTANIPPETFSAINSGALPHFQSKRPRSRSPTSAIGANCPPTARERRGFSASATARSRTPSSSRHSPSPPPLPSSSPSSPGSPFSSGRRGSDSSSGSSPAAAGLKDALGQGGWWIGGRTAGGEDRFYRLGVVKRPGFANSGHGSGNGKGSIDQLSL